MDRRAPFVVLVIWVAAAPTLWGSVAEVGTPGDGWLSSFRAAGGAYAVFRILGYLCLALLIPSLLGRFGGDRGTRFGSRMLLLLLMLLGLAAFQLIPLPVGLYSILAPAHARQLGVLLPEVSWAPISTDPGYTGRAVVHLFLLLSAALTVYHTVRTPRRAWILLGTIVGVSAAGALYGIAETYLLSDQVLGQLKASGGGGVTGTFFYRGNFAAFTACGLGISGAALVLSLRRGRAITVAGSATAGLVLLVALLLSRSRAGLGAGSVALALGLTLPIANRRLAWAAFGGLIVSVGGAALLLFPSLTQRFEHLSGEGSRGYVDERVAYYSSTLDLAAGRPVFGAGFGAYRRAIHLTQSEDLPGELYFAHSDPLNILAEGGALGLLIVLTIAATGFMIALRLARNRDHRAAGAGMGCVAGLVGLLLMSMIDYPLQIPATSLAFTVLLFLPVSLRAGRIPRPRGAGTRLFLARFAATAGFALLLLGVIEDYRHGLADPGTLTKGEVHFRRGAKAFDAGRLEEAKQEFGEARRLQPFHGATRLYLAEAHYRTMNPEEGRREVRSAWLLSRGRAQLLFYIGMFSLRDRALADLTVKSFREASALEERFFPEVMKVPVVTPEMLTEIVPDRASSHDILGRHFDDLSRYVDAERAYLRAIELGMRGYVVKRYAKACRRNGTVEEGKRALERLGVEWVE